MQSEYIDQHREGDLICYYSDLRKMQAHYPNWSVTISLLQILTEICRSWQDRLA